MALSLPKDKTQRWLIILAFLFVAYVAFNELRKADWKKRLESDLAAIDARMGSGRATPSELVDLNSKRKSILQQYLKSL